MSRGRVHIFEFIVITLSTLASCSHPARTGRTPITYDELAPLANIVDIRGIWKTLDLPAPPTTFCHVGLLGWHCHNSSLQPWNPASLIPKDKIPPMPVDASCVICPAGWTGARRNLLDVLIDFPIVKKTGKLPAGAFYNMTELQEAAAELAAEHSATAAGEAHEPQTRGSRVSAAGSGDKVIDGM